MLSFIDYLVNHKQRCKTIRVTFPERIHSYMECDLDMGLVNTKAGVSIPSDWIERFKAARSQPAPHNIIEVQQDILKNLTGFFETTLQEKLLHPYSPPERKCNLN
ncbi:hypothetical protein PoB_003923900 [Plakobranchus ocellatus]|uniref:Uncharacterized protein n=1 Tax=Plakobranchus ocellatus TaxID=259542 RepID=A0AAV4B2Y3_9GAST|nr:hypothetical protein PoB_003923900 [Plakobranchus ocellatus]